MSTYNSDSVYYVVLGILIVICIVAIWYYFRLKKSMSKIIIESHLDPDAVTSPSFHDSSLKSISENPVESGASAYVDRRISNLDSDFIDFDDYNQEIPPLDSTFGF